GGEFEPEKLEWTWPIVEPGAVREIGYRVLIPEGQPPGDYRLEGRINGEAVGGAAEFRVIPPLTVAEAIAHWAAGSIDLELDDRIDEKQLEQAIGWWLADREVPGTGGRTVGSGEAERLIAYHLTGTSIPQLLLPLPAWDIARAARTISAAPDGGLEVTVEIEARSRIYGLRLSEAWPRGWRIEPLDRVQGDPIFKESTNEWLWPEIVEPGEHLTVRYRARPPAGAGSVEIRGTISSALPRFSVLVGGEFVGAIHESPLLTGVKALSKGDAIEFLAEGQGIVEIWVRVFDLSGRRIYDSGWAENGVLWVMDNQSWANGVYLYLLTARSAGGERQKIGKVVILR
ncbi:MAG: hypothetical protein ACE5LQ_07505, partial [Candidatus Bipolaricaulia bacterium]